MLSTFDGRVGQLKTWLPWWLDLFGTGMLLAIGSVRTIELGRATPPRLDRPWVPAASWLTALGAFWLMSTGIGTPYQQLSRIDSPHLIAVHYLYGLYGLAALALRTRHTRSTDSPPSAWCFPRCSAPRTARAAACVASSPRASWCISA